LLRDRERFPPNNIIFVMAGAGVLWLGWNGFNGGDPYTANLDAGVAVLNVSPYFCFRLLHKTDQIDRTDQKRWLSQFFQSG
jgi:hypothetical protein